MILKKNKYNFFFIIIIANWFLFWGSINVLPIEIFKFGENILRSVNALRLLMPLIMATLLIIYVTVKYNKKIKLEIKYNIVFLLFIIFFFLQVMGWLNNFSLDKIYNDSHLLILGSGSVALVLMVYILNKERLLKYLLFISLFIIAVVSTYFIVTTFNKETIKNLNYFYAAFLDKKDEFTFYQDPPRITGISRNLAILNIFNICFYFYLLKIKNSFSKIFIFLIPFMSLIIWGLQSRGGILCFFLTAILIILFQRIISNKKKFIIFFFFIIFPIFVYQSLIHKFQDNLKFLSWKSSAFDKDQKVLNFKETFYTTRVFGITDTSGRFDIWKNLLEQYDKNQIFGYGPQADRHLINKDIKEKFGNNASNAYIYSFLCAGYFGLLVFIIINYIIVHNIFKCIYKKKIFENSNLWIIQLACANLIFFLIRALVENSFALFSIDFLVVIISLSIVNSFVFNKKLLT
jgi:hypothetical protein